MRKIRFRYIKENGQATSVTVRCCAKRNATLISEALRHYQRVERQQSRDKQQRYDHLMIKLGTSSDIRIFDPIELRRRQCSSTLIEEEQDRDDGGGCLLEQTTYLSFFTDVSSDQRLLIIREMYRTESIYIEQLRDLIELITDALQLFTKAMHRRNELFSGKQITTLLGYMDEIFDFQQTFFHIFQRTIEETQPEDILISRCFLRYKDQWKLYRDYSHSLIDLEKDREYQRFYQCQSRPFTELLHLPLQRVNQYTTLLTQLFKSTPSTHLDYQTLPQAIELFLFSE